jgi:hypothetical protein
MFATKPVYPDALVEALRALMARSNPLEPRTGCLTGEQPHLPTTCDEPSSRIEDHFPFGGPADKILTSLQETFRDSPTHRPGLL